MEEMMFSKVGKRALKARPNSHLFIYSPINKFI